MPPTRNCSDIAGPVLDVGCGPGRLTVALTERGIPALGVDISRAAVAQVCQAGAAALHRSVFDPLPGQGRWATVLLATANRYRRPACPAAVPLCPVAGAGWPAPGRNRARRRRRGARRRFEHPDGRRGPVFPWARMGAAALLRAATNVGLHVRGQWRHKDRAFACAARRSSTHAVRPAGVTARLIPGSRRR